MEGAFRHPVYARIAALFAARTGIVSPPNRAESIEASIVRAQRAAQIASPWEYFDRLAESAVLLDGLISELAIGETYFFRDNEQLQTLRSDVFPALCERLGAGQRLQIWSAGCSTGEEPYSLAMLLDQDGRLAQAEILATDLNPLALEKARAGTYREWSMREISEPLRQHYFEEHGGRFSVAQHIRAAVRFELHNLMSAERPAAAYEPFDLIVCRNVVIYFELKRVKELAERFYQALAPGGWLLMGAADAPLWDFAPFTVVRLAGSVLYCKGAPPQLPPPAPPLVPLLLEEPPELRIPVEAVEAVETVDAAQAALRSVQSIATQHGAAAGVLACAAAAQQRPFDVDLQIFSALLLLDLGRLHEASNAARRAIYLDRSSPLAHFVLGTIAQRKEDLKEALISFRNARDCAAALPKETPIPLFEGGRAGQLVQSARMRMMLLAQEPTPPSGVDPLKPS